MKIRFRDTLFCKLSFGLLILMLLPTFVGVFLFDHFFQLSNNRAEQVLHWSVADRLASTLDGVNLSDGLLKQTLEKFLISNPKLSVFILDQFGKIVEMAGVSGRLSRESIPLEPVERLFQSTATDAPIYGVDPRVLDERVVFSAASLLLDGKLHYLYVVLSNPKHQQLVSESQAYAIAASGGQILVGVTVCAVCVATLLFYLLTRRLTKISAILLKFQTGDFTARIPTSNSKDEITLLAKAVNEMAEEITLNIESLQRKDALRRELIANVSHDLRTPVSLISGYTEVFLGGAQNLSELTKRRCELVREHAKALSRMLAELFELAKLEAKEVKPNFEDFLITELIEELSFAYVAKARDKGIEIVGKVIGEVPMAKGDSVMIGRVLTNLTDNAFRYTSAGGKITLSVEKKGERILVKVADTGIGIPEAQLPHIFERLYQVPHNKGFENGLSGLGLAIVRRIIEAHGSDVKVSSTENEGTTFSFELDPVTDHKPS